MTHETETKVHELCEKLDRRIKAVTWIAGLVISGLLTSIVLNTVSYGATKNQVEINTKKLDFVSRDYVPAWFLEGMFQNTTYQTEEIVATLKGENDKVKEINKKYLDFQKTMLNNLIQYRGGMTNITRSIKPK